MFKQCPGKWLHPKDNKCPKNDILKNHVYRKDYRLSPLIGPFTHSVSHKHTGLLKTGLKSV